MATYDRIETVTRRVEFRVPAPEPWGANWVEVAKAASAAISEWRAHSGHHGDEQPPDDVVRVTLGADWISVHFAIEEA